MAEHGIFFTDEVDVCPYNAAHSILRTRMQTHLVKCRKNYPSFEKKLCPFNATHHIDVPEFSYHMSVCEDRRTLDNFKYTVGSNFLPKNIVPVENRVINCDENWDDVDVPTYNPSQHLQDGKLLIQLKGATPSERKNFRESRRQLFKETGRVNDFSLFDEDIEGSKQEPQTHLPLSKTQVGDTGAKSIDSRSNTPILFHQVFTHTENRDSFWENGPLGPVFVNGNAVSADSNKDFRDYYNKAPGSSQEMKGAHQASTLSTPVFSRKIHDTRDCSNQMFGASGFGNVKGNGNQNWNQAQIFNRTCIESEEALGNNCTDDWVNNAKYFLQDDHITKDRERDWNPNSHAQMSLSKLDGYHRKEEKIGPKETLSRHWGEAGSFENLAYSWHLASPNLALNSIAVNSNSWPELQGNYKRVESFANDQQECASSSSSVYSYPRKYEQVEYNRFSNNELFDGGCYNPSEQKLKTPANFESRSESTSPTIMNNCNGDRHSMSPSFSTFQMTGIGRGMPVMNGSY